MATASKKAASKKTASKKTASKKPADRKTTKDAPSKKTPSKKTPSKKTPTRAAKKATSRRTNADQAAAEGSSAPKLLSGGNPQIPKGDGDGPVQSYIAAMPGWKRDVGRRIDALIERTVPGVRKAVRWNTPFYGVEGQGWFLGFHCFTRYVQLSFLNGASLHPLPPKPSKHESVRYLDIHEQDEIDEAKLVSWIKQASELPGDKMF